MLTYRAKDWTPAFILNDRNGAALAAAIEAAMNAAARTVQEGVDILRDIDRMPEWRLDELAWETNCWYDANAPLETKREMIRNSAAAERLAGTARGVENAINAFYPGSTVEEAADYNGSAFHFRVRISLNETEADEGKNRRAGEAVSYFQNLRSVLDGMIYHFERTADHELHTGLALMAARHMTIGCSIPPELDADYLTDAQGNLLLDGLGNRLVD